MTVLSKDTKRSQAQTKPRSIVVSLLVAMIATLISLSIADVIFQSQAVEFANLRNVRTNFAFTPPGQLWAPAIICILSGFVAVHEKQWVIPLCIGLFFVPVLSGGYAWSGPGYMLQGIRPLLHLRQLLLELIWPFTCLLLILWICIEKRVARRNRSAFKAV